MAKVETSIYYDFLENMVRKKEELIQEAFKEHFGFPIESVTDKENLEVREFQGSSILEYRYQNRTFLFWDKTENMSVDASQEAYTVTITNRFLKV